MKTDLQNAMGTTCSLAFGGLERDDRDAQVHLGSGYAGPEVWSGKAVEEQAPPNTWELCLKELQK